MLYIEFNANGIATNTLPANEIYHTDELIAARKANDAVEMARITAIREARHQQVIAGTIQNRNDWKSFDRVTEIAAQLTAATGRIFLPTDDGEYVSPRYDVVDAPAINDEVSYAFNGDSYPDGVIVKINANHRFIWTSNGNKYIRKGLTSRWVRNNTWTLVSGHHFEQNPHF